MTALLLILFQSCWFKSCLNRFTGCCEYGVGRLARFDENSRNRVLHVSCVDKRAKETKSDARTVFKNNGLWPKIFLMGRQNGQVQSQLASSMDKMREISTDPQYCGEE
jgi:UDP-N-acetylglucosamine pyrophosphorylase